MSSKTEKKSPKKKKEMKPAAKSLRDYSLAKDLDPKLKPQDERRKQKPVVVFTEVNESKAKEIVVPKGKGKKLETIEAVANEIDNRKKSDEVLRLVHQVILGRPNKKTDIKSNLSSFNGVVYDDDEKGRSALETKLEKLEKLRLQQVAAFFGVNPKGTKSELAEELATWLEKPHDTGETFAIPGESTSKKRKRSESPAKRSRSKSPSKRKKKDPNAPKRPITAFFAFSRDNREALTKKYPDEKVVEIAKRLGAKWKKLGDDEKKKYEKEAEKDKTRYEKELKEYNKKK